MHTFYTDLKMNEQHQRGTDMGKQLQVVPKECQTRDSLVAEMRQT